MIKKLKYILTHSEKKSLILLTVGSVILALFETIGIGIVIPIMDLFFNQEKLWISPFIQKLYHMSGASDAKTFLMILIVAAMFIFFLKSIYSIIMLYLQQNFIGKVYRRLTRHVLMSYLNKTYSFHLENNSSILFKNVTTEVGQFTSGFLAALVLVSSELIVLLGILSLLFWAYPAATFGLAGVTGSVMLILNTFLKRRIKSYSVAREKYSGQLFKSAIEALNAVKEIQIYNAASFFLERFSQSVRTYIQSFIKYTVASAIPRYILETLLFTGILSVILASLIFQKPSSEIVPLMTVFGIASLRILPSVYKIYTNLNHLQYYLNSFDIIHDTLKEDGSHEGKDKECYKKDPGISGESSAIRLENIRYRFDTAPTPIFKELNLFIPPQATVAFVGESGAGKSTLIDILMGLLIPEKGLLCYGRTVVDQDNISEYRKKVGYVPQQLVLIDDTLAANIAFGISSEEIDYRRLENVIQMSMLESFVNTLPEGIKTMVGEKGVRLSGGQRQRVGIARALFRNPEILILDEATSALDGYTEGEISRALKKIKGTMTIILVAHRLSTVESADIIYVMDHGKIIDQGNMEELLRRSVAFQKIASQQIYKET